MAKSFKHQELYMELGATQALPTIKISDCKPDIFLTGHSKKNTPDNRQHLSRFLSE
jgi:hypothetical protein